jgi:WD40 repeat protein
MQLTKITLFLVFILTLSLTPLQAQDSTQRHIEWHPSENILAVSVGNSIQLVDGDTLELVNELTTDGDVYTFAWSNEGDRIAVTGGDYQCSDVPRKIFILDAISETVVQTIASGRCTIESLDWNADSVRLAGASADSVSFRVWDTTTGQVLAEQMGGSQGAEMVRWKPNSDQIITTSIANTATLFDAVTGEKIDYVAGATTVDWNTDGSLLVTGSYSFNGISVLDVSTNATVLSFSKETLTFVVDWSPDDTKIVAVHSDGTVRIWNAETGELLETIVVASEGTSVSVAWNFNGTKLAYIADGMDVPVVVDVP